MRAASASDNEAREVDPTAGSERNFAPILARSRTVYRPAGPVAYDCVKVIVVRDGSAFLFSEFGPRRGCGRGLRAWWRRRGSRCCGSSTPG